MLLNLSIKNYALIDELRVEFARGLNIFTGETGAGKSIIIESIGLLIGERASSDMVRKGSAKCFISGEFDITGLNALSDHLEQAGLEGDGEGILIIRREIDAQGKSRAFINDTPVSINALYETGLFLVDVHGQHEHQNLLSSSPQKELLDSYAGDQQLLINVKKLHEKWHELKASLETKALSEQEKQRLLDLYSFQQKEIDSAKLVNGEDTEIENELPQLKNSEKLRALCAEAAGILSTEEGSVLERLGRVTRISDTISSLGVDISSMQESIRSSVTTLEDAAREMDDFGEKLNSDPERLNELLERRDLIQKLKKKYGQEIQDILVYRDKITAELNALSDSDRTRQELENNTAAALKELLSACNKLSDARKKAGKTLSDCVEKELSDLGMNKARFAVKLEELNEPSSSGKDRIEFLFQANPGEDIKPLKEIASGGEMSRVMLAIKTVLAKADRVPVLIFDEIDAGIGGPMGQVVGKKLNTLAKHHQVLCITHLPQIAAFGTSHLSVKKEVKAGRTSTAIRSLTKPERVNEVARMLSGEEITPAALKHASELINSSSR